MAKQRKTDLRDQVGPPTTITNLKETFAGDDNRNIMPQPTARMVTPDLGSKVPEGQVTKSN